MSNIYILSEDESDTLFYLACLEKLTNKVFEPIPLSLTKRLDGAGGVPKVRRGLRYMINTLVYSGEVDDTYFLIALDNDRSPQHPAHTRIEGLSKREQNKSCQFCEITQLVKQNLQRLGAAQLPIQGAVAVPVEMLESWLLLILGYEPDDLPFFAEKSRKLAQEFYAPHKPPNQLKDLCRIEQEKLGIGDKEEFYLHCVLEKLEPNMLAQKSDSFALFKQEVEAWA